MRILVESLKRLYVQNRVTLEKLDALLLANIITQAEYEYITQNTEVV